MSRLPSATTEQLAPQMHGADERQRLQGEPVPGIAHGVERNPNRYESERSDPERGRRAAQHPGEHGSDQERSPSLQDPH